MARYGKHRGRLMGGILLPNDEPNVTNDRIATLRNIRQALVLESWVVERAPEVMFQSLWNRMRWIPNLPQGADLFLQKARRVFEGTGKPWLRRMNAPGAHPKLEVARFKEHKAEVHAIAFSPDGQSVFSMDREATGYLWDAPTGKEIASIRSGLTRMGPDGKPTTRVGFSGDGKRIIITGSFGTEIWDSGGPSLMCSLDEGFGVFLNDGEHVLTGSGTVWECSGQPSRSLGPLKLEGAEPIGLVRGGTLLSALLAGEPVLLDIRSGEIRHRFSLSSELRALRASLPITACSFSLDGNHCAFSNAGMTDICGTNVDCRSLYHESLGVVWATTFCPDGTEMVLASEDGECLIVEVESGKVLAVQQIHSGRVSNAAYSPDGKWLVSSSYSGCTVWERETALLEVCSSQDQLGSLKPEWDISLSRVKDPCVTFVSSARKEGLFVSAGRSWEQGTWEELRLVDGVFLKRRVPGRWLETEEFWPCSTIEGVNHPVVTVGLSYVGSTFFGNKTCIGQNIR